MPKYRADTTGEYRDILNTGATSANQGEPNEIEISEMKKIQINFAFRSICTTFAD